MDSPDVRIFDLGTYQLNNKTGLTQNYEKT
jgi:hypothetical protein